MVRREWYVYVLPFEDIPVGTVLSGYATEAEAREEAERVQLEIPKWRGLVLALPRSDERILEYARTHAHWASEEEFKELLVKEGDVGTLAESVMAEDTAGRSRRIPAGTEVKISSITPKYVSFITSEAIEGEKVFTALPLTFRKAFRKGVAPPTESFAQTVPEARAEAGIMRCRFYGSPYLYRENLEMHEKACPKKF